MIQIQSLDVTLHSTWHARIHCRAPTQHNVVIQRHPVVHVHLLYCNQVAYQMSGMLQCCPYQLGLDSTCLASSPLCHKGMRSGTPVCGLCSATYDNGRGSFGCLATLAGADVFCTEDASR